MSDNLDAVSMVLLGLLGSGHCLGMCGPLVIALPGRFGGWTAHLLYHLGRLSTYTIAGFLLGGLSGLGEPTGEWRVAVQLLDTAPMTWISRLQIIMAGAAALFLLLFGLNRLGLLREPEWLGKASPHKIPGFRQVLTSVLGGERRRRVFVIGLMLGWLPCGLSYAAFARSLATGSAHRGAFLTLMFGIGTLPGLLALGTGAGTVLRRYRRQTELIAGLIMTGMAVMLAVDAGAVFF